MDSISYNTVMKYLHQLTQLFENDVTAPHNISINFDGWSVQ